MAENTARPARPASAALAQTSSAAPAQTSSATASQIGSATVSQTGGATPAMAQLKYDDKGLVPAIVQQYNTGEVLMLAYMNEGSLKLSQDTKTTWFWSRSRGMLWHKGATSGHVQHIKEIRYDCDADCLLVLVDAEGPACHTGARSCFYRRLEKA